MSGIEYCVCKVDCTIEMHNVKRIRRGIMKKYLYIGCGGFLGAILRYVIKNAPIYNYKEKIPLNTFIINITGSLILAFILSISYARWKYSENLKLGITTGFLGAFTTFSTMCKETVTLFVEGYYFSAISYVEFSVLAGIALAYFGSVLCNDFVYRNYKEDDDDDSDERIKAQGGGF